MPPAASAPLSAYTPPPQRLAFVEGEGGRQRTEAGKQRLAFVASARLQLKLHALHSLVFPQVLGLGLGLRFRVRVRVRARVRVKLHALHSLVFPQARYP